MHELKDMQRARAEQQERVAARLERSQDEIISFFHDQKMAAYQETVRPARLAKPPVRPRPEGSPRGALRPRRDRLRGRGLSRVLLSHLRAG
eukprot:scaffold5808_cov128-Isochrysis_galbana.AAC.27